MEDKLYWFWLCNIEGIGQKKLEAIINYYKSPYEAFTSSIESLSNIEKLNDEDRRQIKLSKDMNRLKDSYAKLLSKKVCFVTKEEKVYPEKLLNIYNPPHCLYVKGGLPSKDEITIAVVGSRICTDYGKELAIYFARELARMGICIVSGLALGVDGYAHKGALDVNGKTYGILGCGIDTCYPKENIEYYMEMQGLGGVISEYGLNVLPRAYHFPMRNRIISGMSDGILVIEAKEKSGSFITVDMGLEQGKQIYAVPGRINDELSKGCNNLIKMGAKLVSNVDDILEDFSINYKNLQKDNKKNDKLLETKEKIVYASLSFQGKHINEIAMETNLSMMELTEILFSLELKNYIKQIRHNYYSYIII